MSTELMGAQHPNSKIPIIFDVATTIKNKNDIFSFHFFFSDPEPKQNIKTKTLFLDSLNPKADDNQNQWRYLWKKAPKDQKPVSPSIFSSTIWFYSSMARGTDSAWDHKNHIIH